MFVDALQDLTGNAGDDNPGKGGGGGELMDESDCLAPADAAALTALEKNLPARRGHLVW